MDETRPLDPDEVACPTCRVDAGVPCRQPSGRKARAIHYQRRRAAERGEVTLPPARSRQTSPGRKGNPKGKGPSPEAARKGAQASAQARRRRAAELAAAAEAAREEAEREAIEAEAQRLAEDASRFARDRAALTRKALDAADLATDRLLEGLTHLYRPAGFDEEGKPRTEAVELFHTNTRTGERIRLVDPTTGAPAVEDRPAVVGWYSADQVETLAKVAASTLNSLRLEEGKPTGIERHEGAGTGHAARTLGEAGVDELLEWAGKHLPREGE